MKNLIAIIALSFLGFAARAQTATTTLNGTRYSIGIDAGVPGGYLSHPYTKVLGGSVQADIPVDRRVFITLNAGYNNLFGHTYSVAQLAGAPTFTTQDVHLLPIKAGLKVFPLPHFYLQGEAGATLLLNKAAFYNDRSAAFTYAPQIGLQLPVGGGDAIDAGLRYEKTSRYKSATADSGINFWSLRLAFGF
nr:hypothetical protein [uncultured Mucilaginibacter sp.]